jgi:hypothetical protein
VTVVEASYGDCPDRTLWVLGEDGLWRCHCCRTTVRYSQLVDPVQVRS